MLNFNFKLILIWIQLTICYWVGNPSIPDSLFPPRPWILQHSDQKTLGEQLKRQAEKSLAYNKSPSRMLNPSLGKRCFLYTKYLPKHWLHAVIYCTYKHLYLRIINANKLHYALCSLLYEAVLWSILCCSVVNAEYHVDLWGGELLIGHFF